MQIGVLALQGAFIEHRHMLEKLGASTVEIRQKKDLQAPISGLIIPGGESTTMGKLLRELDLFTPIQQKIKAGFPVFGTCAGLILLAKEVSNDTRTGFKTMDIRVKRNAYGRQLGSFVANAEFGELGKLPMVFIRAPYIEKTLSDRVEVLATVRRHIVAARQGNQLVTCFHPELTDNAAVHRYFLEMVEEASPRVQAVNG